jgi:hypothetical protein
MCCSSTTIDNSTRFNAVFFFITARFDAVTPEIGRFQAPKNVSETLGISHGIRVRKKWFQEQLHLWPRNNKFLPPIGPPGMARPADLITVVSRTLIVSVLNSAQIVLLKTLVLAH